MLLIELGWDAESLGDASRQWEPVMSHDRNKPFLRVIVGRISKPAIEFI